MLLVVHHVSEIWVTTSFTNFYNDHISKFEATGSWDLNPHKIYWHQFIGTDITDTRLRMILFPISRRGRFFVVISCLIWYHLENCMYFCHAHFPPLYIVKFSNPRRITEGRTTHVEMSTWARCLLKGSPDQLKNHNVSLHLNIHFFRT